MREMCICPMCDREHIDDYMTLHHLLPAVKHKSKGEPTVYICKTCHNVIHYCHTNEELRYKYFTLDAILSSSRVQNMISLYNNKPDNCVFKIKRLKKLILEDVA